MSKPLFDLTKCDVPFVNSVDFRFVSECSIQPPPPPIFDCPEPPKTFRIVPECPSIDGSIMISTAPEGCIPARKNIIVTRTPRCGGNEEAGCNFFIDLDLAIPVPTPPCPSIAGSVTVKTFPAGCKTPKNSFRVKPKRSRYSTCENAKSKPGCLFDFDLNINVPIPTPPCPIISAGSIKTSVFFKGCKQPKNSIRIRKRSLPKQPCGSNSSQQKPTCAHTIDLIIDIPVPRPPCPSISGGSVSLSVTLTPCKKPPKIKVRRKSLPPPPCGDSVNPACAHVIDLDLTIPVPLVSCPSIAVTAEAGPRPSITRKKTTTASCKNALKPPRCEFVINIPPPPCPVISAGSLSLSVTHATCITKKNKIRTRRLSSQSDANCRFAIDIDLTIPVPKVSCPALVVTNNPGPKPSITRKKTTAASCKNALTPPRCEFSINIPPPLIPCPEFSTGSFSIKTIPIGKKPSGILKTRKLPPKNSSSCRYAFDIDIEIPTPGCPEFSKGSFSIKTIPVGRKPSGVAKPRKLAPKNSSSCRYAFDIDLEIPVPGCPEFSKGSFSIKTIPVGRKPSGVAKPRKLAPKNSSSCRYAFDIDLEIPVPGCPEFSKGSFSIKTIPVGRKPSGVAKPRKLAPKNSSSCRYAFDIDLEIPVPGCTEFSKGSFSIKTIPVGKKPSGVLKTRKLAPKNSSSCRYAFDIDLEIPVPGCPEFSKGSFSIKTIPVGRKPSGVLKPRKLAPKNSSSCRYAFDIDLEIPVPGCPEFSKGSFSIKTIPVGRKPSGVMKPRKLAPKNSSSCRYAFDIDIEIPTPGCPEFSKGSFSVKMLPPGKKPSGVAKPRKLAPKNSSSCRYAFDIDLEIPVPGCPEFSKGSFSIKTLPPGKKPSGVLKPRKLPPKNSSSCRYAFDIDLGIPVPGCPEFSKGSFSIKTVPVGKKPSGVVKPRKLAPKNSSSCRYAFDIDLEIPVPGCPEFSKGSFSMKMLPPGKKPSGVLKTRKLAPKNSSSCRYAFDIDLEIPVPGCPEFSKGSFSIKTIPVGRKPSGVLKTRKLEPKNSSSCRYAFDIDLEIPVPGCPEFSKGSFSVKMLPPGKKPSGVAKPRKLAPKNSSSCRYAFDIDLEIPIPGCPEFSKGSFSIKTIPVGRKPSGVAKPRKLAPKNSSSCRYAFDINIEIPVPGCPEFSKGSFSIKTLPVGKKPSGVMKPRKLQPKNSSSCRYAFDIDLGIPVPGCPEFSKGSFSIKTLPPGKKPSGVMKPRKLAPKNSSSCRYAFDINIEIPTPGCPEFSKGSFSIKLAPGKKPSGVLKPRKLEPKNSSSCRYAFDIDLQIPVPLCPQFSKGSFSIKTLPPGKKPSGVLKPRKLTPKNSSSCRYAFDIDLGIPVPGCPEFSKGSFSIKTLPPGKKPSGVMKPRKLAPKNSSSCRYAFDIDLGIPVPGCPEFSKGSFSVKMLPPGKKPSGIAKPRKLAPKNSSSCRYAFDIDLAIPVPACPEFSKGSFSVKMDRGRKNPTGAIKTRKIEGKNSSSCRYAFDFDLKIPVPPCPQFSAGSFSASIADPDKYSQPKGKIKVRKLQPKNSSSCRYAIDFNIKIPVPEISCALISIAGRGASLGYMTQAQVPSGVNPKLKPGRCKYVIYASRASVRANSGQFTRVDCDKKDSIRIKVEKEVNRYDYTYVLTPQIWVRKESMPSVRKGNVNCAWTACDGSPTCLMSVRRQKNGCTVNWYIDLDIKIPEPPKYVGGLIDLGTYGAGNISITGAGCQKTIGGKITLDTTTC